MDRRHGADASTRVWSKNASLKGTRPLYDHFSLWSEITDKVRKPTVAGHSEVHGGLNTGPPLVKNMGERKVPRQSLRIGERGKISTLKMENGRWRARCFFRDSDGQKRPMSRYGRTKAAASGKLNDDWLECSKRIMNGRLAVSPKTTVQELFEQWVDYEWKRSAAAGYPSPRTLRNRHSVMGNHALPRIGQVPVNELTVGGLNAMLADIPQSDGRYLATAVQMRAALTSFCQYAMSHQLLSTNLARETEPIFYRAPEPRPLTAEEIARIRILVSRWQLSRPNIRIPVLDVIDFMLGTGCRIGEALAIQWENVHLNDPVPWVRIVFAVVYDRQNPSALGATKANKVLHIALPIFAAEMLYRRWAAAGYPEQGLVFHRRSGRAYTQSEINGAGRRALAGEQIVDTWDGGFKSHALRKSVLNSVNDQFGLAAAAEQGGHSSQNTTKKYYLAPNVKTINYTESLSKLIGMEAPVMAEDPTDTAVVDRHVQQQDWIPADVRRMAESLLRGEVPEGVVLELPPSNQPKPDPTTPDDSVVDEAPPPKADDAFDVATGNGVTPEPMGAQQYWDEARKHASKARSHDTANGGVVVIDNDTQTYRPPRPGLMRVTSTPRLGKLRF